jgi:hypothetical protein
MDADAKMHAILICIMSLALLHEASCLLGEVTLYIFYEACEINGYFLCYEIIKYEKSILLKFRIFTIYLRYIFS